MKRTGYRYRSGRAAAHYDCIVIGSGIGGICTAALQARLGRRVCVREQHYTAGGFTHSYERKDFEWDVGVHYIGDVHRPHHTLRRIFDVISDGQLKWARMDAVYERIMIGRRTVDYSARVRDYIWNQVEKRIEDGNAVMAWRSNRRTRRAGSLR
jgi:all-trans-retinol 13,14-reductase